MRHHPKGRAWFPGCEMRWDSVKAPSQVGASDYIGTLTALLDEVLAVTQENLHRCKVSY